MIGCPCQAGRRSPRLPVESRSPQPLRKRRRRHEPNQACVDAGHRSGRARGLRRQRSASDNQRAHGGISYRRSCIADRFAGHDASSLNSTGSRERRGDAFVGRHREHARLPGLCRNNHAPRRRPGARRRWSRRRRPTRSRVKRCRAVRPEHGAMDRCRAYGRRPPKRSHGDPLAEWPGPRRRRLRLSPIGRRPVRTGPRGAVRPARLDTWSETGRMTMARTGHIATLLPDGTVLVVGGFGPDWHFARRAEIYNPSTGTWARTRSMPSLSAAAAATVLSNGRVLVVGSTAGGRAPVGRGIRPSQPHMGGAGHAVRRELHQPGGSASGRSGPRPVRQRLR